MTFERTTDKELIKRCVCHPKVWPHVSDDASGRPEDFQPVAHPAISYIAVKDEEVLLGIFILSQQGAICVEIHTCLLPVAWKQYTLSALQGLFAWIWQNTACQRVVSSVPEYNRLALQLGKRAGMTVYGTNERSFLKGGVAYSQILLGITRPA